MEVPSCGRSLSLHQPSPHNTHNACTSHNTHASHATHITQKRHNTYCQQHITQNLNTLAYISKGLVDERCEVIQQPFLFSIDSKHRVNKRKIIIICIHNSTYPFLMGVLSDTGLDERDRCLFLRRFMLESREEARLESLPLLSISSKNLNMCTRPRRHSCEGVRVCKMGGQTYL